MHHEIFVNAMALILDFLDTCKPASGNIKIWAVPARIRMKLVSEIRKIKGLDIMVYKLIAGKSEKYPFVGHDWVGPEREREIMIEEAKNQADPQINLSDAPGGQPVYHHLLSEIPRQSGDPDWKALTGGEYSFAAGFQVGVGTPLLGSPAVFERKTKYRRLDQTDDDFNDIWLNKTGTFGIGCAAYYWDGLGATIGTLFTMLMFRDKFFETLYADDFKWVASGGNKFINFILVLWVTESMGFGLTWKKCRGGIEFDYVGFWCDYKHYHLGISESRAAWLVKWIGSLLKNEGVLVRDFVGGLGRLMYAAGVLERVKPFLGPIFAWASAVPGGSYLQFPHFIAMCLRWIMQKLQQPGGRVMSSLTNIDFTAELFRADAKAQQDDVVIGGWETRYTLDPKKARWYSLRLEKSSAFWMYWKGEPYKVIAALELMATLVSLMVFLPEEEQVQGFAKVTGLGDNSGNRYCVAKMMTSKFPLNIVLMELSEQLEKRNLWLQLDWIKRDTNVEADALTNEQFHDFDPKLRIPVEIGKLRFVLLNDYMKDGLDLFKQLEERRAVNKKERELQKEHGALDRQYVKKKRSKGNPEDKLRFKDPW